MSLAHIEKTQNFFPVHESLGKAVNLEACFFTGKLQILLKVNHFIHIQPTLSDNIATSHMWLCTFIKIK